MITAVKPFDLDLALDELRDNPEAFGTNQRISLAQTTGEALAENDDTQVTLDLLRILACDRKWEVRYEVAAAMLSVPDDQFDWFAGQLKHDVNHYVRQTALRAIVRRKQAIRQAAKQKKEHERLDRQRRQLESQIGATALAKLLRFCQRQGDQLVGAIVHDLRCILTFLKASCFALMDEAKSPRKAAKLRDHLEMLENTVSDMELFTEPAPRRKRKERLRDVILDAIEAARENVRKCQLDCSAIHVRVEVSEAIVLPMARHLILMAFTNVIKNALEAYVTNHGAWQSGSITINAETIDGEMVIKVSDDGPGMAREELAEVASLRPGRRNKRKLYSTGFGLPIAARNLAMHDGTISLRSQENVGTTITMTLPAQEPED